jgi:hypothetical protein
MFWWARRCAPSPTLRLLAGQNIADQLAELYGVARSLVALFSHVNGLGLGEGVPEKVSQSEQPTCSRKCSK